MVEGSFSFGRNNPYQPDAIETDTKVAAIDLYKHWIANSYSPSTEQMSLIERRHRRFPVSVHALRAWF